MRRASLAVFLVFASASATARAADEDAGNEADEVRVRGSQAAGFVSRARLDEARREVTDAASLVEPLPGVHVRRLGADDSFATLSIRGSSSTQVAVYLAGVPLSGGADPTLDLATLPLWPGAQARVHRTFAPAALGPGSLGGTLVLDPPSARSPARSEVWAAAGSFGSRRLRVGDVRGDPDGVRVATALSASRGGGEFEYLDRLATFQTGDDVFTTRRNAGHAAVAGLASVAIPIRATGGALTITNLAQARRQELPGAARFTTPLQRLDSSRLVSVLELTLPASRDGTFGVRGWGRREGLAITDAPTARFSPSSTDDAIIAAGGSVGWRGRPTTSSSLELRIDGSAERFAPGAWVGLAPPPAARRASAGVALDASTRVADVMTLAASARGDTWVDAVDDASGTRDEQRPTAHLGIEAPLGPVVLATHGGFVTRRPSFVERYGNRGGFIGDPALAPESAFAADLGARFARRLGRLRVELEASGFGTWAEQLITFVPVGANGAFKATNIGRARLVGIESVIRAAAFGFDTRVSHTALTTANQSECRFVAGSCERPELPGRPTHDVVFDVSWTRGPVRLRYGLDAVAGIYVDTSNDVEVPARVLHGAGAMLAVPGVPGLSVTADVRNLLDVRVGEYVGALGRVRAPIGDLFDYPLPGRNVLFSVRWTTEGRR